MVTYKPKLIIILVFLIEKQNLDFDYMNTVKPGCVNTKNFWY